MNSEINLPKLLKEGNEKKIEGILRKASELYYSSSKTILSDQEFDILKDFLEEKFPNNGFLVEIGAPVKMDGLKVQLPVHMGSMNKKKTEKEVESWMKNYPGDVIISDKLDGISFLLVYKPNEELKLYTRGDGTVGKDISKLLEYLKLPNHDGKNMIIRGEMLVSKSNFKKMGNVAKNGRSFISGISNLKEIKGKKLEYMKYIDLVCYELIKPIKSPKEQFETLKEMGFKVVENYLEKNLNFNKLSDYFIKRKDESDYEVDGIIITQNKINERNVDKNPKYSFAFKMDLEYSITKVLGVEWNISKHGVLKPTVLIEPVVLYGSTNSKATGHNADFIMKNKIGKGAMIKLIKGGEIIPKVEEVIVEAEEPDMPDTEYTWNSTHKEILIKNIEESDDVKLKRLIIFFKTVGVENIGPGTYTKMYNNGFNTLRKIWFIKKEDLLEMDGIKEKSASNIIESLDLIIKKDLDIKKVVSGSCILGTGFGEKVLDKILMKYPKVFSEEVEISVEKLCEIESIQEKTANKFIQGLHSVRKFLKENNFIKLKSIKKKITKKKENKLLGNKIVITGFRDKKISEFILENGGEEQSNVNKNTSFVLTNDINKISSKIKKANELNVEIVSLESFRLKYKL